MSRQCSQLLAQAPSPSQYDPFNPSKSFFGFAGGQVGYGCQFAPTAGRCYFLPPARRLIVNPDGVQLVFYDNELDFPNAALALRYALHGYGLEPVSSSFPEGANVPYPNFLQLAQVDIHCLTMTSNQLPIYPLQGMTTRPTNPTTPYRAGGTQHIRFRGFRSQCATTIDSTTCSGRFES